jgi:signal transduction histidine kinase
MTKGKPMPSSQRDRIPRPLIALILVASILIILGAVLFYQIQKEKIITRTFNELAVITYLKTEEVRKWRQDHIRDGVILSRFLPMNRIIYSILEGDGNINLQREVRQRLMLFLENYDYHSVLIINNNGKIILNYPESASTDIKFLPLADFKAQDVEFSDLHYSDDMDVLHIDMVIPIIPPDSVPFTSSGTIILRIDPALLLFPNLRIMTTPTLPAEILLVRRDGDSVTYLNNVKGFSGGLLKKPMHDRTLPSVRAAEGMEGTFEGHDYRDVPALSYLRKIPDSPWYLVAKVDKEQALSFLYKQTIMAAIIVLLFISLFTATIFYLWRNQNIQFYKELSKTKDKFVSIITHDLTSPFTSIVGFSEILVNDVKKGIYANTLRFAEIIHDSSLTAMDLLKNLALWSRTQTDQIRPNLKMVDLSTVIDESVQLMKVFADRKSISIKKCTPDMLQVCIDREMIYTVLRNLLSNAVKYSYKGGEIHVSAERSQTGVLVKVRDFGTGISSEIIDKIFDSDNRITLPGTSAETGTGLGLMLCREFVERHGGTIHAESIEGQGSTFVFSIPDSVC